MLVVNMENRFTEQEIKSRDAVSLADLYLGDILRHFVDREVILEITRSLTGRAVLVSRDPDVQRINTLLRPNAVTRNNI